MKNARANDATASFSLCFARRPIPSSAEYPRACMSTDPAKR